MIGGGGRYGFTRLVFCAHWAINWTHLSVDGWKSSLRKKRNGCLACTDNNSLTTLYLLAISSDKLTNTVLPGLRFASPASRWLTDHQVEVVLRSSQWWRWRWLSGRWCVPAARQAPSTLIWAQRRYDTETPTACLDSASLSMSTINRAG